MSTDFAALRREYRGKPLLEGEMDGDPLRQFQQWLDEATRLAIALPNAMALATVSAEGRPSVRYVLLKAADARGFVFYTHSISTKGRHLAANPHAALVFYWQPLDRQLRLEGPVEQIGSSEADAYFQSRPYGSQLSVHVAAQSAVLDSREFMQRRMEALEAKYPQGTVPRPDTWVGYRLRPELFEFWQGRENRLHDRLVYRRGRDERWSLARLAP